MPSQLRDLLDGESIDIVELIWNPRDAYGDRADGDDDPDGTSQNQPGAGEDSRTPAVALS